MENPLSGLDSQPQSLSKPATGLNKVVTFNEPQIITEPAEESEPPDLNKQTEDRVPQTLDEPVKFSQPQIMVAPPEESRPPKQNEEAKDSEPRTLDEPAKFSQPQITVGPPEESRPPKQNEEAKDSEPRTLDEPAKFSQPQIMVGPPEESRPTKQNEEAKDSEPQDQPTQDHRLQDLNEPHEDNKRPDLNELAEDLKNEAEAQRDAPQKTSLDKEDSPLSSSSTGQEITTTDDVPAPKPSLDNRAQGLPEPATDLQPQALKALIEPVEEEPAQHPQDKKEASSQIGSAGLQEKTRNTEKAGASGSFEKKRCSHFCGHNSVSAKPMFSWSPSQLAKATLSPKRKPQTADKATQILPGRVPMLTKLPPKRVLPPKPKPPSADKATEISPSFEKLLKRPPPLVKKKKKKKKEETSAMTMARVCPQATRSSNPRQPFSSHYGRSPHAAADRPPLRVKSSKSRPLRMKRAKSVPLRVKLSSSSPSKHRLNLSLCPRKKRKIMCNIYITFCDNWEEPKPCRVQQSHWEERLSSCSGLYRACCVFSIIKYGRIHVSELLLALHMLGILVTSDEMRHVLRFLNVGEHESLNFCEFLEAVNTTSPFAEIEAFQNTLHAFRKMRKGAVTVKELEPVLLYLGVTLSPEAVQQTLGHTKVNKNGRLDISDFLLAAKDLQRVLEEEEEEAFLNESAIFKRTPFQDVAGLVDAECRRRRKYWDCLDEETPVAPRHLPLSTLQESDEDAALDQQQSRASSRDVRRASTASSINTTKEDAKDGGDAMEVTTSQLGLNSDLKSSSPESLVNNATGGNKDNDAMELGKSQLEPPSQNIEDPVPSQ